MVSRKVWQGLGIASGILGAAGAAVGVGVLGRRRHSIAKTKRRLESELAAGGIPPGAPPGVISTVVADDGVKLECETLEPAQGREPVLTVVLVHGLALDRRTWYFERQTLPELNGPSVRTVLYDQRSHGRSERASRESCTLTQLGQDLQAVIDALAPRGPIVLVGHSMGGMTLMALAEQNPTLFTERVLGIGLISTSAGEMGSGGLPGTLLSRHNPLTRALALVAMAQPRLVEHMRRSAADLIWAVTRHYAYGDQRVDPALVDLVDSMISANAVDALTDFVPTLGTHDRLAALPALAGCEGLVLAGNMDRLIPCSHSKRIAAELPEAKLVTFEGVGHMPMLERHAEFSDALADLLERAAAQRPRKRSRLRRRA